MVKLLCWEVLGVETCLGWHTEKAVPQPEVRVKNWKVFPLPGRGADGKDNMTSPFFSSFQT